MIGVKVLATMVETPGLMHLSSHDILSDVLPPYQLMPQRLALAFGNQPSRQPADDSASAAGLLGVLQADSAVPASSSTEMAILSRTQIRRQ